MRRPACLTLTLCLAACFSPVDEDASATASSSSGAPGGASGSSSGASSGGSSGTSSGTSSGGPSGSGSCTFTEAAAGFSECIEYGSAYAQSAAQAACTAEGALATYSLDGCASSSGGSCTVGSGPTSYTFTITSSSDAVTTQTICTELGGVYSGSGSTGAGSGSSSGSSSGDAYIGSCTFTEAAAGFTECVEYGSAYPPSSAQAACTAEGSTATYSSSDCPRSPGGLCTVGSGTAVYAFTISGDAGITTQTECVGVGGTFTM